MTTTTNGTAQDAADNFAQGLGSMVWWDLWRSATTPVALRLILDGAGMDPAIVKDIDPVSALRKATSSWSTGRGNDDRYRSELISVADDGKSARVGILRREHQQGSGKVDWLQVEVVEWALDQNPVDAQWTPNDADRNGDAVRSCEAWANQMMTHLGANWIRKHIIQRTLDGCGAFNLRRQGGVQFVLAEHDETVQTLAGVVRQIGDSALHVASVSNDARSRKSVGSSAKSHILDEVKSIREKLDVWTTRAKAPQQSAVDDRLATFKALRDRAGLFAGAMEMNLGDLLGQIGEAEEVAKALLGRVGEASTTAAGVSDRQLTRWKGVMDKFADRAGDADSFVVVGAELLALQVPASCLRYKTTFAPSHGAGQALRQLGWRATLDRTAGNDDENFVTFTKTAEGPIAPVVDTDTDATTPIPEPTPEPELTEGQKQDRDDYLNVKAGRLRRGVNISELRRRYAAARGSDAPIVDKVYTKGHLALDVATAEFGAQQAAA